MENRIAVQATERPEWTKAVDARAASLQDLWNVLRFAELALVFVEKHLSDANWWMELRGFRPSIREVSFEYMAFSEGAKFGVFHLASGSIENALRSFLRAIAPGVANDARAEFKSVYDSLLKTQLQSRDDDLALLDLVRLVRNTIHNSGVHRQPSRQTVKAAFRGIAYEFPESGPIEFVTWQFVLERVADYCDLLDRVIRHPRIWSHGGKIAADWAEVYRPPAA